MEPLFTFLKSRHSFDYEFPTYPGHGNVLDLTEVTGDDWFKEALDAYNELAGRVDKIYVIGFSMGGVFAAHIAQELPVDKLVLIAPAFDHTRLTQLAKLEITPKFFSEHMKMNLYRKVKKRLKDIPLRAFQEFKNIVEEKAPQYGKITSDTLIVHGTIDLLVPYKASVEAAREIEHSQLELIEDAPHLFAFTEDKQLELNIIADRFLFGGSV